MTVGIHDKVNHGGRVTTIAELDAAGQIEYCTCRMQTRKRNGERHERTVYTADIKGTRSGWEINKTAYLSRTGQQPTF